MTTRSRFLPIIVLAVTGSALLGAQAPATDQEKVAYALGVTIARSLAVLTLTESDVDMMVLGMRDVAMRRQPRVSLNDYTPQMNKFTETRRESSLAAEKSASADYLKAESEVEGTTTSKSGLLTRVLRKGDGPTPGPNDTVKLHYHATLRNGVVFDSSVERGEPVTLRSSAMVPCWTEALSSMGVGSKVRITCPPELAYGDKGEPPTILPGAALTFELELLDIVSSSQAAN